MKLEYYPIEKLKKEILNIFRKYLDLNQFQIFFFGSRVEGKNIERSDIDIGIQGAHPLSSEVLSKIEEEIDKLPILYKIEIVDFSRVSPKFKKIAIQHIELLNKKEK